MTANKKYGQALRVLFLTTSYPLSPLASQGIFVHNLATALAPYAEVRVLTPHLRGAPSRRVEAGVTAKAFRYAPEPLETLAQGDGGIPEALRSQPWRWVLVPSFLIGFWTQATLLGPWADVVHAQWAVCGWLAVAGRGLHRRPVVTTLRGSDELLEGRAGPMGRAYRRAVRGSALVTSVNRAFVAHRDPAQYRFVPNGVGPAPVMDAREPRAASKRFRFLFVGALIQRKRVEDLLRAFAAADLGDRADLRIVGDGPLRGDLLALCETLGLRGTVQFEGNLPHPAALQHVARSDCLVLPSAMEGRPNVVLEAMAAGKPVIASQVPGTLELVRQDESGLTFPVGDVDALAGHLGCLCEQRQRARALGEEGRRWIVAQGLTWEACAKQYLQVYQDALEIPRP